MNKQTTFLLSLAAGVAVGITAIPYLDRWLPPAPGAEPGAPRPATPAASGATSPADTVRGFLEALTSGDEERAHAHLTTRAREGFGSEQGFQLDGEGLEDWELGAVEQDGDQATVALAMTVRGNAQPVSMKLRTEDGAWRLRGIGIPMGEDELAIDFEGGADTLESMGAALAEELAEGLAASLRAGFEEAQEEWSQGGSTDAIAGERAAFEALRPLRASEHEDAWRVSVSGEGRPVRVVLEELLQGADVELDASGARAALEQPTSIELTDVSRLAALEALCAEAGLVPVFPRHLNTVAGGPLPLAFRDGPRALPAATAGPFLLEVEELVENAPHTTGELRVTARALGLAPAFLAANQDMHGYLSIDRVTGSDGSELLADPDVSFWMTPQEVGGLVSLSLTVELSGLLSSVESIASIEGTARLRLPTSVESVRIDPFEPGAHTFDDWSVECVRDGDTTNLRIDCMGHDLSGAKLLLAPDRADGTPLGMRSWSSWAEGASLTASLDTTEPPAALRIKLFEFRELEHPFALREAPLRRHAAQPAALASLELEGDAPLEVSFVRFTDRSDADFPRLELALASRCNKEILSATATFVYLDADGEELESFPHDLSGISTFEGQQSLSAVGTRSTLENTAFFMPAATERVEVRLDAVSFVDGTTWERD